MQIRWAAPGILLVALGLAVVGCSGVRDDAPFTTPGSATSPDGEAADPFVGMWDFDFEGMETAPFSFGMLMIDEPCVYTIHMSHPYVFEFIQVDDRLEKDSYLIPLVAKRLLGLARHSSLRFDHETGQISYEDSPYGPMSTGDYVSFGHTRTTVSSPEEAFRCSSTSIDRLSAIGPWILPSWLRDQLHIPATTVETPLHTSESSTSASDSLSDPFIGMWDYDPEVAPALSFAIGMLVFDEPCAYIVTGRWSAYTPESRDEWFMAPIPHKHLLALPRAHIRFDRDTDEIWYKDVGPMATGDYVSFGGSPSIEASPEEASRCSTTRKIRSAELSPWTVPDWLRERLGLSGEPGRN